MTITHLENNKFQSIYKEIAVEEPVTIFKILVLIAYS